jgi:hypothetical protein
MQPSEPESSATASPGQSASLQLLSNATPHSFLPNPTSSALIGAGATHSIIVPKPSLITPVVSHGSTPSQKDFAIALGVSQARISQLVKIGMPLNSITAAKEWRVKRQRYNDDVLSESGSPDPGSAFDSKLQHAGVPASHGPAVARTLPQQAAR